MAGVNAVQNHHLAVDDGVQKRTRSPHVAESGESLLQERLEFAKAGELSRCSD